MPYLSKYTGVNGDFNESRRSSNSSVKKALEIAPDFYDAWNNLGGIYGGQGKYQTAYEHYMKAHECNPQKPNPVFGLMLTSKDLGKFDECIEWCDVHHTLCKDGKEIPIKRVALKALGRAAESTNKTNLF
jgi:tetratricopeptide (TPR) repeat protein